MVFDVFDGLVRGWRHSGAQKCFLVGKRRQAASAGTTISTSFRQTITLLSGPGSDSRTLDCCHLHSMHSRFGINTGNIRYE